MGKNAKRKTEDNFDFLLRVKNYQDQNLTDRIAKESHGEAFSGIDYTKCTNCCKVIRPTADPTDIKQIASELKISESDFFKTYLKMDENNEYKMNALPCLSLKEDKCSIFEIRPGFCREFPHTPKEEFTSRKFMYTDHTQICPSGYHIFE